MWLFYGEGLLTSAPNTVRIARTIQVDSIGIFRPLQTADAVSPPLVRLAGEVQHYHSDYDEPKRHHLYARNRLLKEPKPYHCHERRTHPCPNSVGHAQIQPI